MAVCITCRCKQGVKLNRDSFLAKYQYQYKAIHFPRLLQDQTVPEPDKAVIRNMLTKPWNLYVFRHSALTEKSQILTESTLRDHADWTMTSKMPTVYLHYFGTESAKKLLEAKGVIQRNSASVNVLKAKPCPNCGEYNKPDSKFCSKCKFVLSYDAFNDTIEEKARAAKEAEETMEKLKELQLQQQILKAEREIQQANHENLARFVMGLEKSLIINTYDEKDSTEGLLELGAKLRREREAREEKHKQWHRERDKKLQKEYYDQESQKKASRYTGNNGF